MRHPFQLIRQMWQTFTNFGVEEMVLLQRKKQMIERLSRQLAEEAQIEKLENKQVLRNMIQQMDTTTNQFGAELEKIGEKTKERGQLSAEKLSEIRTSNAELEKLIARVKRELDETGQSVRREG